jgi:uncharacterized membrane protein YcaP (DUF421 family)
MYLLQAKGFDWRTLLLGEEDWSYLPQVLLKSAIMFIVAVAAIRIIGKRAVLQGVFELVLIITLATAAGDPMIYKKVGLLPSILAFITVVGMYKITSYFLARNRKFEHLIEGRNVRLIKDQRFAFEDVKSPEYGKDEIFSDLRMLGVSHLGQVDAAYVEASGNMSVFFLPDEKVTYGLPIRPELYEKQITTITKEGTYSCAFCGYTEEFKPAKKHTCRICKKTKWVLSINDKRVK